MTEYRHNNRVYYACGICGLAYTEKSPADKCEEWCSQGKG